MPELKGLKAWLYRQRTRVKQESERAERRRAKKEAEVQILTSLKLNRAEGATLDLIFLPLSIQNIVMCPIVYHTVYHKEIPLFGDFPEVSP